MIKIFPLCLILFFFLISCVDKNSRKEYVETIFINPKLENSIAASEIIEDIKLVPLETNKNSIIGEVDKIIFYENHFYILDRSKQKTIFVFDKQGKFIQRIGTVGNGPGEYNDPSDFIINKHHEIEILDRFNKKKIFANLDGVISREEKINIHATRFDQFRGGYVYFHYKPEHNRSKNHVTVVNESENHFKEYLPENNAFLWASDYQNFSTHENNLFFIKSFDNVIYIFSQEGMEQKYLIDFNSHFISESDMEGTKTTQEKINVLNSRPEVTGLKTFNFFNNHLFFTYNYDQIQHFNLYNLKNKKIESFSKIENDINGISFNSHFFNYIGDNIVSLVVPAYEILNTLNNNPKLLLPVEDINEADNPVLVLIKFKEEI